MTRKYCWLAMVALLCIGASSSAFAQSSGEDAFNSYMQLAIGGTWTTTAGNERLECSYRWAAAKKFAQITFKGGVLPFVGMIGIDPETKKCTWWFYNEDGSLGTNVMTKEGDGVWMLQGTGKGAKGETRYKGRISRVDDNTITEVVLDFVANGDKQPTGTFTWKRNR